MGDRQWYSVRNADEGDTGPAELLIYDIIDSWAGVSAEALARDVKALEDDRELVVRINSPGGSAYDGVAILNSLRAHPGKVTVVVDGIAASAASLIAMAGDEVVMNRNSEMMIHNGHAIVRGGAEDMRKMAERLDSVNANIASIYAEKAGGTAEEWLATMAEETWYSAEEAVKAGLADRVNKADADANKVKAHFDLTIFNFNHAGRANAPAPRMQQAHNKTPQPKVAEVEKGKEPTVALSESVLQKLGLKADADDSAIEEAINTLAERPTTVVNNTVTEPSAEQAAEALAKLGMVAVNKAAHDQMQASLAQLESDRADRIKAENEAAITNALTTGRIDAASADTWRAEIEKNRDGTLALLNTLPANKAVPVNEIGHGVSREDQNLDAEMATVFASITGHAYGKDA